ncbi:MAG TPA: hypothetical protein VK487_06260 [Candidatus Bathyarchaeia archaeon]|nr:hypothetical protein [Candidatus Bathyarchaeia archaeon]
MTETALVDRIEVPASEVNDERNKLFNISILSAENRNFIEAERKISKELLIIRPTLHIYQMTEFGETKTALANRIENYCKKINHPCRVLTGITAASVCGSIDDHSNPIPPASLKYRYGTMIIDEFQTNSIQKTETIGSMLDVIENERSSRNMARVPKGKTHSVLGKDCEVRDGELNFRNLRSNWIFLTAKNLKKSHGLQMAMLMSRCVPISKNFTFDELDAIDDDPDLLFKPLNLKVPEHHVIKNVEYLKIRTYVKKGLQSLDVSENYYFRTICDCLRAYVYSGYQHDTDLYAFIIGCKAEFAVKIEELEVSISELEKQTEGS